MLAVVVLFATVLPCSTPCSRAHRRCLARRRVVVFATVVLLAAVLPCSPPWFCSPTLSCSPPCSRAHRRCLARRRVGRRRCLARHRVAGLATVILHTAVLPCSPPLYCSLPLHCSPPCCSPPCSCSPTLSGAPPCCRAHRRCLASTNRQHCLVSETAVPPLRAVVAHSWVRSYQPRGWALTA